MNTSPTSVISGKEGLAAGDVFKYPQNILGENRAVQFSIRNYNKGKVDESETENVLLSIYLPMPEVITDSMNHSYDSFSGGGADRILSTFNSGGKDIGSALEGVGKEVLYQGSNALLKTLSSKGGSLGDLGKVAQREAGGIAINPRTSVFFNNTALKIYSFEYLLIPRNRSETEIIDNIVKRFQFHSLPDTFDNGNGLIHPEFFSISFMTSSENGSYSINEFLVKPNPCVLTQVSVTYNESSSPVFFHETGGPVAVRLSLQFQEIEIETKTSFEAKYKKFAAFSRTSGGKK